jgi:hypothetical protein
MTDENNSTHSPVPPQGGVEDVAGLSFYDALKEVAAGKRITRQAWENKDVVCYMKNAILMITPEDGVEHSWMVSEGDMGGVDWIVVE